MAAKKKKPEEKGAGASGSTRSLRDDAKKELARSPKHSPTLKGQTTEELIHEHQVHQIELETQAEELRRAKLALEESRDKYLDLYDFAPIGYLTLTDKARVTGANLTGATLLGVDKNALINHGFSRFIAPGDLDRWDRYFVSVRKEGEKQTCTLTLIRGDGAVFPAWLESIRLPGSRKGTTTVRMAISDITDIGLAEEALRENEERLRTILHSMQTGIIVIDADTHTILDANQKSLDMIGETKEKILGSVCHSYICPAEMGKCPITDLAQTIDNSERVLISAQGKKIPILKSVIQTILGGKKVLVESFIDITERKLAADTIALTTRKLTLMNDVTYQYIQNKVTGLRGYAELSKDAKTEAERLSFIEKEQHILADIHHLIKNTQEYQEIGLLLPRWIPVEQSIRIAVSLVSPKQDISIETALHGLELYSDPLIEKIFANLIENAVLHGKTTTRITFSCEEMVDGLTLTCEDDGVGISPKDKARLFDRIVGEKIRFGLFFVHECTLLSGMTIAETGEPGKGARFEIAVPKGMYRFMVVR